jgi:hypothetical protein
MEEQFKEVYFDQYCKTCKHEKVAEEKDPCHECLSEPTNLYSHTPVNWEEKE